MNTTTLVDKNGQPLEHEKMPGERQKDARALTVLEAAAQNDMLVILGDPGSGKSSFVNQLMFALANHLLDPANALPEHWPHGALLPVRILLRELAMTVQKAGGEALLQKSTEACERELARLVHAHIAEHLADYDAPDFSAARFATTTSPFSGASSGVCAWCVSPSHENLKINPVSRGRKFF